MALLTGQPTKPGAEDAVRTAVVWAALSLLRTPYRWGRKDLARDGGLDCSGFAQACLRAGGIAMPEASADMLWSSLPRLRDDEVARAGDLAFYGDARRAHHVVIVLGTDGSAIIGANGGGPPVDGETADAYSTRMMVAHAGVRIEDWRRGGARYREDFLGYARLPWERSVASAPRPPT